MVLKDGEIDCVLCSGALCKELAIRQRCLDLVPKARELPGAVLRGAPPNSQYADSSTQTEDPAKVVYSDGSTQTRAVEDDVRVDGSTQTEAAAKFMHADGSTQTNLPELSAQMTRSEEDETRIAELMRDNAFLQQAHSDMSQRLELSLERQKKYKLECDQATQVATTLRKLNDLHLAHRDSWYGMQEHLEHTFQA